MSATELFKEARKLKPAERAHFIELLARQTAWLEDLTRILKLRSRTAQPSGERTPLACSFRRPAENLVPLTFPRGQEGKNRDTRVSAGRPNRHASRVRSSFPIRSPDLIDSAVAKSRRDEPERPLAELLTRHGLA